MKKPMHASVIAKVSFVETESVQDFTFSKLAVLIALVLFLA